MSFVSLPRTTEKAFADYLTANYSGDYQVNRAFSVQEYRLPMILVEAKSFAPVEPASHFYKGTVEISVNTQIDDVADPETSHDATLGAVYDLLADKATMTAGLNACPNFNCANYDIAAYENQLVAGGENRALVSVLTLEIWAQTLD